MSEPKNKGGRPRSPPNIRDTWRQVLSVRISPDLVRLVKERATSQGRPLSQVVEDILHAELVDEVSAEQDPDS